MILLYDHMDMRRQTDDKMSVYTQRVEFAGFKGDEKKLMM